MNRHPVRFFAGLPLLAALTLSASCGSNPTAPELSTQAGPSTPAMNDIPFELTRDIRDNLIRHYAPIAAKPPARGSGQIARFDFVETRRVAHPGGMAGIRGHYLFALDDLTLGQGTIEVFFRHQPEGWQRTGFFIAQEEPIALNRLTARVTDDVTGQPLPNARVVARRANDEKRSSRAIYSNANGQIYLEVLSGVFTLVAEHPEYDPAVSEGISVARSLVDAGEIRLSPRKGGRDF